MLDEQPGPLFGNEVAFTVDHDRPQVGCGRFDVTGHTVAEGEDVDEDATDTTAAGIEGAAYDSIFDSFFDDDRQSLFGNTARRLYGGVSTRP